MGKRYESSKRNVSDNKRSIERLHMEKDTLTNEYAPLSLLDSIQVLLDDEATDAIQDVRAVGQLESQRIESEMDTAEEDKQRINGEINSEIAKLNAGLEKLKKSGNIEFGKKAVEQSSSEYKKQIDDFKQLQDEINSSPKMDSQRQKAVADAWEREQELVLQGKGTRDWSVGQQIELITTGKVRGFEGQHMLNVSDHPELAGDERNIQFLTFEEHFYGAHDGNWKNSTEGKFDPETNKMISSGDSQLPDLQILELTNTVDASQAESLSALDPKFGYSRHEGYDESKEKYRGIKSKGSILNDT